MIGYSLNELDKVAKYISDHCSDEEIFVFDGEIGAGKTTLIKSLCELWKVVDTVSSPTFSIVNEYSSQVLGDVFHFDFYRIEDESEAEDIGIDNYFYSGQKCLIEWASKIPNLIPDKFVIIEVTIVTPTKRSIQIVKHG